MSFLRYSTGGSGMISGLFFWRPIEKKIFCRYAISFWRSLEGGWPQSKFPEISRKFPGNFRKFLGNFSEISRKIPRHPGVWIIYVGGVPNPGVLVIWVGVCLRTPLELQIQFSRKAEMCRIRRLFLITFIYLFTNHRFIPVSSPQMEYRLFRIFE